MLPISATPSRCRNLLGRDFYADHALVTLPDNTRISVRELSNPRLSKSAVGFAKVFSLSDCSP